MNSDKTTQPLSAFEEDLTRRINVEEQKRQRFQEELKRAPLDQVGALIDTAAWLSPAERRAYEREVERLKERNRQRVEKMIDHDFQSLTSRMERIEGEEQDIAAELDRLIQDVEDGMIEAADLRGEYADLENRMNNVKRARAEVIKGIESLRIKEDDPLAYYADLERKYPAIKESIGGLTHRVGNDGRTHWRRSPEIRP